MEFRFCQIKIMTSNFVIVAISVCLDVGNEEYIILCNFSGSSIMSGLGPARTQETKNNPH